MLAIQTMMMISSIFEVARLIWRRMGILSSSTIVASDEAEKGPCKHGIGMIGRIKHLR